MKPKLKRNFQEDKIHEGFFDKLLGRKEPEKKEPEKTLLTLNDEISTATNFSLKIADLVDQALATAVKQNKIDKAAAEAMVGQCKEFYDNAVTKGDASIDASIKLAQECLTELDKKTKDSATDTEITDFNRMQISAALKAMQKISDGIKSVKGTPGHFLYYGFLAAGFKSMCYKWSAAVADIRRYKGDSGTGLMEEKVPVFSLDNYAKTFRERITNLHKNFNAKIPTLSETGLDVALQKHFSGANMALKPLFGEDLSAAASGKTESFRAGSSGEILVERWQKLAGLIK